MGPQFTNTYFWGLDMALNWVVPGLFFFRQTTDLTLYVPLFSTEVNRFRGNPVVADPSPCFSQKNKFSTTYAIVPFFCRPFNENFKFLKNDFLKILHNDIKIVWQGWEKQPKIA